MGQKPVLLSAAKSRKAGSEVEGTKRSGVIYFLSVPNQMYWVKLIMAMNGETWFLGVDGCKGGWICVGQQKSGNWQAHQLSHLDQLLEIWGENIFCLIDMPIGLPTHRSRECDGLARRLLQARRSSVFPIPSRASLMAPSYEEACRINSKLMGKKLSKQSWNIGPKIMELDQWLAKHDPYQGKVREAHPELAFYGLAGKPLAWNKKQSEGKVARLDLLGQRWEESEQIYHQIRDDYLRKDVADDDIIDAMALCLTAMSAPRLNVLPSSPELDERGLRMEIVFGDWTTF